MSNYEDRRTSEEEEETDGDVETDHLDEIPDGAGCTEIWDKLSEQRGDD